MAAITIDNKSDQVLKLEPATGYGRGQSDPYDVGLPVRVLTQTYTAPAAIAANKTIALLKITEPCRILYGKLYCDGAVATATCDVGITAVDSLVDTNKAVFGAAVPIATAGTYSLADGLASGTGVPGSLFYEVTVPSYVYITLNTAGLAKDDVLKIVLFYQNKY